ncbi:MAG TPA: mismatch-specific DNA-glycosylase [Steroidobacteraceae bacterium]|nr:mismatch-specific DNA-glycosylase [Steroidobacteraceae bacterium]
MTSIAQPGTLPEYLASGLDLVLVGINPGMLSARRGHYFARRSSRFWPAFSRSRLSARVRAALGREALGPEDDLRLLAFGIGLTDLVGRATGNASQLSQAEFEAGAPRLRAKLEACRPRVACFHGVTAYRAFARYALGQPPRAIEVGPQAARLGATRLFVTPSPSAANAHFRPEDYVFWYDRLDAFLRESASE